MLDDFRRSVQSIIHERMVSPVFGTFLFSWVGINWKVVLIIISTSLVTTEKISAIESLLILKNAILFPLISTLVLVVAYPWISIGGFYIWEAAKKKKRDIFNSFDGQTVLTLNQSIALRLEMKGIENQYKELFRDKKEIEESYQKIVADNNKENNELAEELEKSKTTISSLESKLNGLNKKLDPKKKKILLTLNDAGDNSLTISDIVVGTNLKENDILYHLDGLMEQQLAYRSGDAFTITSKGRKYVYEAG